MFRAVPGSCGSGRFRVGRAPRPLKTPFSPSILATLLPEPRRQVSVSRMAVAGKGQKRLNGWRTSTFVVVMRFRATSANAVQRESATSRVGADRTPTWQSHAVGAVHRSPTSQEICIIARCRIRKKNPQNLYGPPLFGINSNAGIAYNAASDCPGRRRVRRPPMLTPRALR